MNASQNKQGAVDVGQVCAATIATMIPAMTKKALRNPMAGVVGEPVTAGGAEVFETKIAIQYRISPFGWRWSPRRSLPGAPPHQKTPITNMPVRMTAPQA